MYRKKQHLKFGKFALGLAILGGTALLLSPSVRKKLVTTDLVRRFSVQKEFDAAVHENEGAQEQITVVTARCHPGI